MRYALSVCCILLAVCDGKSGESSPAAPSSPPLPRQQVALDGTVDASASYLRGTSVGGRTHNAFFVTTTYGKTVAIDADSGTVLWQYTPPGYDTWAGTPQITNATPVADPNGEFLYAAAPDGQIRKLAVADGHEVWSTAITRDPRREKIASPVTLHGGRVIAVTGGYVGDAPSYQGHVAILDAASGRLLSVWNTLCSDRHELMVPSSCPESGSAIWGRSGAVVDSSTGNIFVATGNGRWDGRTNWGDAVLVLDSNATTLLGNYTPANTQDLAKTDMDLGSASPVLLGGGYVAQGGKDGKIRLLDLRRILGTAPHSDNEVQTVPTPSGSDLFGTPAVLHAGATTWVFASDNGGTAAWTFSNGRLQLAWRNGNAGTTPAVADGRLYVYDPGGVLRVYQAESGNLLMELSCGRGHWNFPIVADDRIALPEGSANSHSTRGILNIWRLR
jgi:outer membrane protein assembly factor BamB